MARIRSIKPEYWADEKIASLTFPARLLAIALLNYADDEGYFNANEKLVKAFAFPLDDSVKIPALLRELSGIGYVVLRSCQNGAKSGQSLGLVTNFLKHQYINKPRVSSLHSVWEASGTSTVGGTEASAQEGNGKERNGREQEGSSSVSVFVAPTVEEVKAFAKETSLVLNADYFVDFFEAKGWITGKTRMRSWKAAARNAARDGWTMRNTPGTSTKAGEKSRENYRKQMAELEKEKNETT